MRLLRALFPTVLALQMCSGLFGQEVVSARSGMVHFTEGQVFLDGQPLDRKSGSFPGIKEGSTLRTEKGRAEILLTPGAFLRLDDNSSIKMVSTELADTRLVFENGSAILDLSDAAQANNGITITYKDARVKFPKKGVYRLDGDTGVLQVYSGGAMVTYAGQETQVDPSHLYFCWLGLETNKLGAGTEDEFYDWASDRSQTIGDENQLAQQTGQDPGDVDPDPSAQLGAGAVPYSGSPGLLPPSVGPQVYPVPYSTYAIGGAFFNPFSTFGPTPYLPFSFPMLLVVRPNRTARSLWPHSGTNPVWHPLATGRSSLSPLLPARTVMPRPMTVYRPISVPHLGPMARPSAPVAIHAVGHR
jgi:hypothetical protein